MCYWNNKLDWSPWVSRSMKCDQMSVLSIYPRIFLSVFIVYHLLVGFLFLWLYSAICWCVLVVLVKLSVLSKWLTRKTPLMTLLCGEDITSTKPRWKRSWIICAHFFVWFVYVALCFPCPYTLCIIHAPMARYSPMCWNTNRPNLWTCVLWYAGVQPGDGCI